MPSIGLGEWIFIFLIVLVIFGPSSLPKIGRGLGKGIREFKDALSGIGSAIEREEADKEKAKPSPSAVADGTSVPREEASESSKKTDA
ncbi:MAG: twin-arginine translocase TatA/TatE family subunit [Candidatus Hydrogenedentota bacterium]|nr:MAG: twin-arginine translocase TatA/TatE family subunit [Candidatus Hydrogenedentota bacterium]